MGLSLSDVETRVLSHVTDAGDVDLYDLAQAMDTGPTTVQDALQPLARDGLVDVQGRTVRSTDRGRRYVEDLADR